MLQMLRYGGHHGPQPGLGYYTLMSYREELTTLTALLGAATGQAGGCHRPGWEFCLLKLESDLPVLLERSTRS